MCFLLALSHKYLNSYCKPITVLTIEFRDSAGLRALIWESVHRDRRLLLKAGESKDHFYPLPRAHYTSNPTGTESYHSGPEISPVTHCQYFLMIEGDTKRLKNLNTVVQVASIHSRAEVDTPRQRLSSVLAALQARAPTGLPWASLRSQRFGLAFSHLSSILWPASSFPRSHCTKMLLRPSFCVPVSGKIRVTTRPPHAAPIAIFFCFLPDQHHCLF